MLRDVDVLVPIGEFSKMTYLSVKALRHYHDVGLLAPSEVDPATGYRLYSPAQVPVAQAIRRFRDLDMPLEQIRTVLDATDVDTRNDAILAHLDRMQHQLERTQQTVASLQALLSERPTPGTVELRSVPAMTVLAITEIVEFEQAGDWLGPVLDELRAMAGPAVAGPDGALYPEEFFQEGVARVTAFVPVEPDTHPTGRAVRLDLPPAPLAVIVHEGSFDELDRTYGALGEYVTGRGIGAPGPIREHYLPEERTEVCWPVTDPG